MEFGIEKYDMLENEKWGKRNVGSYRTANPGKYQNAWRDGKVQGLGIFESEDQSNKDERKIVKKSLRRKKEKTSPNQERIIIKEINTLVVCFIRFLGSFVKLSKKEVRQIDQVLAWFGLVLSYLPTPPLGQDMTQGQFLSGV